MSDIVDRTDNDEWFRSSDETGKTVLHGLAEGPSRFVFVGKEVEYSIINGRAIFEGDIYLGEVDDLPEPGEKGIGITGTRHRWPWGIVPYEIDPNVSNQKRITDGIEEIHNNTRIRLVERNRDNAHLFPNYIYFFKGDGCWSMVGMQGGRQKLSLADNCSDGSTIHEILHALGLWHEQSRADRNEFVTIHFENIKDGRQSNFEQHIADGDDIGAYDYGSIMHYNTKAFSKNRRPTIVPKNGAKIGQRRAMSAGDANAVAALYPVDLLRGRYTIEQSRRDGSVMMRLSERSERDDTQPWVFTPVGMIYTVRQAGSGRFMDGHDEHDEDETNDFSVMTRTVRWDDKQLWGFVSMPDAISTYTIQQIANGRYLDAHQNDENGWGVMTRPEQGNDNQRWLVLPHSDGTCTLQQKSSGRFMNAAGTEGGTISTGTEAQTWYLKPVGGIYLIQQTSTLRYLDAHERDEDMMRKPQQDKPQLWGVIHSQGDDYTIQQVRTGRHLNLNAHVGNDEKWSAVTNDVERNETQIWTIKAHLLT